MMGVVLTVILLELDCAGAGEDTEDCGMSTDFCDTGLTLTDDAALPEADDPVDPWVLRLPIVVGMDARLADCWSFADCILNHVS